MPDVYRYSLDKLGYIIDKAIKDKLPMVALFPYTPNLKKDKHGTEALNPKNLVCRGIKLVKKKFPEITAAGGKVINQNSEILFIYRNKKWDLPKGKAEKNENISQTALREVIEETGIKNLSIVKPLEKTYHIFKRRNNHYLKSTYWFEMYSDYTGKFKPQKKEGISRVEWIGVENLESVLPKSYANIRLLFG